MKRLINYLACLISLSLLQVNLVFAQSPEYVNRAKDTAATGNSKESIIVFAVVAILVVYFILVKPIRNSKKILKQKQAELQGKTESSE
jgi:hypothetical protein